ncbi:MAG TPA: tRNA (adenosine(37)-N6)-threonylcarbamoyltransferase complex dimerization subunit type 1 TsaB [Acidimicrobiales bacterium]|nr:tRNA (adenosine(37)-N6)-threonylcarbamoyltransferase complex dimerization subunit type 1 TsaB [Acidimicrobiales bacterium]
MNILAIETATPACAVALRTADGAELSFVVDDDRHHTEALTPGIRDLLIRAALAPKAIDRVVVDRGPGLFTGLRVGIATAIGFALGAGADLVGVTSLELLAHGAKRAGVRGTLVGAVDGRRGEVFVQAYDLDHDVTPLNEPTVSLPQRVVDEWARSADAVTFTGDGVARYESLFTSVATGSVFDQRVPSVIEALWLGARRQAQEQIVPLYLREADAVANFTTRERSP